MNITLVCFDISDDKLRSKVAKTILEYGQRVQGSVFEVSLRSKKDKKELVQRLQRLQPDQEQISADEQFDIRFYPLCKNCQARSSDLNDSQIAISPAAVII